MGQKASVVLQAAQSRLKTVSFDPRKAEHIKAFVMLHYGGRQHPTLRFHVEQPFLDVRSMMIDKLIRKAAGKVVDEVVAAKVAAPETVFA